MDPTGTTLFHRGQSNLRSTLPPAAILATSHRFCADVCKRSGSSFYRSFWLLRSDRRRAMMALYAFARLIDDLSDQEATLHRNEQVKKLGLSPNQSHDHQASFEDWRKLVESLTASVPISSTIDGPDSKSTPQAGESYPAPLDSRIGRLRPALAETMRVFAIEPDWLLDMIDGMASDLETPVRVESWEILERYCYQVAGTVGLSCLAIWGNQDETCQPLAVECGLAFQLTNILRDIHEDAQRNRIYLPLDLLREFHVDETAWIAGQPDGQWQDLILHCVDRAKSAYQNSWAISEHLSPDGARMFSLVWRTYRALLDNVESNVDSLWSKKQTIDWVTRFKLVGTHFFTPAYQRLRQPIE